MLQNMHSKKRTKLVSVGMKTLSLALTTTYLVCGSAYAAGMGKLTVLSSLGQPLRAEIELTSVTADDKESLTPKLASSDAYKQANIDYSASLSTFQFAVETRGARSYILVTTTQPLNEPFIDILLELNSSTGKLLREYTILIDPSDLQSNTGAASTPSGTSAVSGAMTKPAASADSASPVKSAEKKSQVKMGYHVVKGDTLSKIAEKYKPDGVTLDQMLVALQRNNPRAFIKGNMNLLRSGRILSVPDTSDITKTSTIQARKIVVAQSADFNAYRSKVADQITQAAPDKETQSKTSSGGKITAKVNESGTETNTAQDKLTLSKAKTDDQTRQHASEEEQIAKQKTLDDANRRVKELEKNTADLQRVLEEKNKIAAVASASATASITGTGTTTTTAAMPASAPQVSGSPQAASQALTDVMTQAAASLPVATADTPVIPGTKPKKHKLVAPPPEPDFVDNALPFLPYAGGFLALLGALGLYLGKRKKKRQAAEDDNFLSESSLKDNSVFGSGSGQSVDTNNSVFNTNFSPSATQLDANEVDPVAEADVYIAYGRDEQAEEILKEALRTQPERHAARVKLLEIYAQRKDARSFETVATELYGMTGGQGAEWPEAARMGKELDPDNPLYSENHSQEHPLPVVEDKYEENADIPPVMSSDELLFQEIDAGALHKDSSVPHSGLDFDLGSDTPGPVLAEEPAETIPDAEPQSHTIPEPDTEISLSALDFDFEATTAQLHETTESAKTTAPVTAEPLPAQEEIIHEELPAEQSQPEEPLTEDVPSGIPASPFAFDLSSIDLDLPNAQAIDKQETSAEMTEEDFNAEMATKLDLAIAYQEIGDKEGSRELLQEVIQGGSTSQIARANQMLKELN